MYSIRVYFFHPQGNLIVRYLTFDSYTKAVQCKETLESAIEEEPYTKRLYFEVAIISYDAIGELISEKNIECKLLEEYLSKTI
ncbi:TPA: hypothetical protein ACQUHF_004380 [Bacillus paranthracis]|uniref:hypothetical protein n=1 Tax=Bacillus cereus group TaxID=86661 RepID=UPI0022DEE489|nr:hypothetical protein [Bacillus cereus group sp. TH40LC]MDA1514544.1 hypothetical protein [Bacillus cereus group sp. TH40LC]